MKKRLFALTTALLLLFTLTACGAKSETAAAAPAASTPASEAMTEEYYGVDMDMGYVEEPSSTSGGEAAVSGQKLIRTASLEMETLEFETTNQALNDLVADLGGYMESSSIRNRSSGYRNADYVIRIPADSFQDFLDRAGTLCHETWRSVVQDDISEVYYDTQGRLKTQQIKLERLQSLLAKAETMEDIITIESAISETEMLIDNYSGTLRHYDGKVDYATIDLSLREVYKYSNTEEAPTTFGDRLGNSFMSGWANFVDAVEDLVVGLAYGWMWIAILAVIAVAVVKTLRKKVKARKPEKMGDKQDKT
ncbi:MAG: DUF4349 domain-containing protein [Oscillibacter sp.]|nr:DUF4349 domain-containing protein [Oscillibacter sp.]